MERIRAFTRLALKQTLSQPAVLFLLILEVVFVLFLAFGVRFSYENGYISDVTYFGKGFDGANMLLISKGLAKFLWNVLIFLWTIGLSFSLLESLKNSLVPLMLTRGVKRAQFLLGQYGSTMLAFFIYHGIFSIAVGLALTFPNGFHFLDETLILWLGPSYQMMLIAALVVVLGMFFEKPQYTVFLVILLFFVQPTLYNVAYFAHSDVAKGLVYLLPPIGQVNDFFTDAMLFTMTEPFPWYSLVVIGAYLTLAVARFQWSDIAK